MKAIRAILGIIVCVTGLCGYTKAQVNLPDNVVMADCEADVESMAWGLKMLGRRTRLSPISTFRWWGIWTGTAIRKSSVFRLPDSHIMQTMDIMAMWVMKCWFSME